MNKYEKLYNIDKNLLNKKDSIFYMNHINTNHDFSKLLSNNNYKILNMDQINNLLNNIDIKTIIKKNINIAINILKYEYKYIYTYQFMFEYLYICQKNDIYKLYVKKILLLNKINEELKFKDEEYFKYIVWILYYFRYDFNLLKYFINEIINNNNKKCIFKLINFIIYSKLYNDLYNGTTFHQYHILTYYFIYYYIKKYIFKIYKINNIYYKLRSINHLTFHYIFEKNQIEIIEKIEKKIENNIYKYIDLKFTFIYLTMR